jgi:hypothetical protein
MQKYCYIQQRHSKTQANMAVFLNAVYQITGCQVSALIYIYIYNALRRVRHSKQFKTNRVFV